MLAPIKIEDIPRKSRPGRKPINQKEVLEFCNSGEDVMEIHYKDGQKAGSVASNYVTAIRRLNLPVQVIRRKERVFLIRARKDGEMN